MSANYLKKEKIKVKIGLIWDSNPRLSLIGKLKKCLKFYKEFCVRKLKECKLEKTDLRQQLSMALMALQGDPANAAHQSLVNELSDMLQGFEKRLAKGQHIRSRIKWMKVGDSDTKEFYKAHKQYLGTSQITTLEETCVENNANLM